MKKIKFRNRKRKCLTRLAAVSLAALCVFPAGCSRDNRKQGSVMEEVVVCAENREDAVRMEDNEGEAEPEKGVHVESGEREAEPEKDVRVEDNEGETEVENDVSVTVEELNDWEFVVQQESIEELTSEPKQELTPELTSELTSEPIPTYETVPEPMPEPTLTSETAPEPIPEPTPTPTPTPAPTPSAAPCNHSWLFVSYYQAPTCGLGGLESQVCAHCGESRVTEGAPTGKHMFEVETVGDCCEKEVVICVDCYYREIRDINVDNHLLIVDGLCLGCGKKPD